MFSHQIINAHDQATIAPSIVRFKEDLDTIVTRCFKSDENMYRRIKAAQHEAITVTLKARANNIAQLVSKEIDVTSEKINILRF